MKKVQNKKSHRSRPPVFCHIQMAEAARISLVSAMDSVEQACNKLQQITVIDKEFFTAVKLQKLQLVSALLDLNARVVELQNRQSAQLAELQRDFRNATRQIRGVRGGN